MYVESENVTKVRESDGYKSAETSSDVSADLYVSERIT